MAVKKLFADKLESGKVIVRDGKGWARVLTPPCGVNYCPYRKSWTVNIPNLFGEWTTASFYDSQYGPMEGFKQAIKLRERELNCLLNRRLLPRIRRQYTPLKHGDGWAVRDPFTQSYVTFKTRHEALAYNEDLIAVYIGKYTLTRDRMITIAEFG